MNRILADTGYFVALGQRGDRYHQAARRFLASYQGQLVTVSAVIVEACHFLVSRARVDLLGWAQAGSLSVVDVPITAYADLAGTMAKYADQDVDFADAALVWLAGETGLRRVLTVDETDFSLFRIKGGKRFDVIQWRR